MTRLVRLSRIGELVAVAWLASLGTVAEAAADELGRQLYAEPSPLATLIEALPGMPKYARLEFAAMLLDELVAAYEAEIEQAMAENRRRDAGRRDLQRWSQGIAAIIDELRAWQAELYVAAAVEAHVDRHNQILLMIDGRPLWIAWPRISAGPQRERDLAAAFCLRHDCPGEDQEGEAAVLVSPPTVPGRWSLSQFRPPTWESEEGVNCEFPDATRLGEKEQACRGVIEDLQVLAAALRAAWRGGEPIDWPRVALRAGTTGGQHRITVNARDDYIVVYVPALAAQPVDWPEASRWLRARVEGGAVTATVLRAVPGG